MNAHGISFRLVVLFVLMGGGALSAPAAWSQDNPFRQAQPPMAVPPPAPAADREANDGLPPKIDPVIRHVTESQPSTPEDVARSIRILLDYQRPDLALPLIQQLKQSPADDAQWFALYRRMGTEFFFEISLDERLQPDGKLLADQVFAAATRHAADPVRLEGLIDRLTSDDIHMRSAAADDLAKTGEAGAAAVLTALADPTRRPHGPRLRAGLHRIGTAAQSVLLSAAEAPDEMTRAAAIEGLGHLPTEASLRRVYASSLDPAESELVRQVAALSVQKLAGREVPTAARQERVRSQLLDFLASYRHETDWSGADQVDWRWDSTIGKLVSSPGSVVEIEWRRAAGAAVALARAVPTDAQARQLAILTDLGYHQIRTGLTNALEKETDAGMWVSCSAMELENALHVALDQDWLAPAIGACRALQLFGSADLLVAADSRPASVVRALGDGDPRLTAAACAAIAEWKPEYGFSGSSHYLAALVRSISSTGQRRVLIAHSDVSAAQSMAAMLERLGFHGQVAQTGSELFQASTMDGDLEWIVLSDLLQNPSYIEVVAQLRRDPRTRRVPIMVLVSAAELRRAGRWAESASGVTVFPWSLTESFVLERAAEFMPRADRHAWLPASRRAAAQLAMRELLRCAAQPGSLGLAQLGDHQRAIAAALATAELAPQACQLLGLLATPFAQSTLAEFAVQSTLREDVRGAALDAFEVAIRRSGILLTTTQIQQLYDRYNAAETESAEMRGARARLLDALEGLH